MALGPKNIAAVAWALALVAAAGATVIEDADQGKVGDFFLYFTPPTAEREITPEMRATAEWVTAVREERGIDEPLTPVTAGEAQAELTEPPLAPDEVRFSVDEAEGLVEYIIRNDTVSLHRNARVAYRDMTLSADEVRFFSSRDLIIAEGYCELTDPQQTILGVRMSYDLQTEKGVVLEGAAESAQGYYGGRRIKKIGDKTIVASRGAFTTCDLGHPHYRFWSPQLKVYVEDKVVARPAVLFAGEVPVAAAPFYFFSLRKDRHSGFLSPYIRYVREHEFVINNGYYWVLNDYADVTFLLDYDSERGWNKSANLIYLYGSKSTVNNFYASHMRQRDTAEEWWKIYANHRQDFSDSCAGLLRLDLRNSTAYDQFLEPEFEIRSQQDLESFANISQSWEKYQLSAEARQTITKTTESANPALTLLSMPGHELQPFDGIIQKSSDPFPRVLFYATRQEIDDTQLYYQYDADWTNYQSFEEGQASESVLKEGTADASISRPFSILRYLRVDPGAAGHGSWFDRDRYGPNMRWLGTWDTSVSLSTKLYGIFEQGETTYRHIINPVVTHYYRPFVDQSWMVSGGYVTPEENSLGIDLIQTLDVKLPEKKEEEPAAAEAGAETPLGRSWEDVYRPKETGLRAPPPGETYGTLRAASTVGKVVNLVQWNTGTTYDFTPPTDPEDRPFTDLTNSIEITPNFADWYYLSNRMQFRNDFYSLELLDVDVSTTVAFTSASSTAREEDKQLDPTWRNATDPYGRQIGPGDESLDPNVYNIDTITGRRTEAGEGMGKGWNISLTHDYNWSDSGFGLHTLKDAFSFDLTKKWRLGYDNYYDIEKGELIAEHYRIYRNLHRWEAEVRISFEDQEVTYWFQLRLVDLPEIQLYGSQGRTY